MFKLFDSLDNILDQIALWPEDIKKELFSALEEHKEDVVIFPFKTTDNDYGSVISLPIEEDTQISFFMLIASSFNEIKNYILFHDITKDIGKRDAIRNWFNNNSEENIFKREPIKLN
jgi:hypothetical protein